MEQELHFEHGDLTGEISVTLIEEANIGELCEKYVHGYNRERFQVVALRIFIGKETVVTLYAADKLRENNSTVPPDKIPVKKFKIPGIPLPELFSYLESLNCTLTTNTYPIEQMQVINK